MMQKIKFATIAAMLALSSACAAPQAPPAQTASASRSSVCLIMRELAVSVAPAADVDDPRNRFDTDQTVLAAFEHNAALNAACPKETD